MEQRKAPKKGKESAKTVVKEGSWQNITRTRGGAEGSIKVTM